MSRTVPIAACAALLLSLGTPAVAQDEGALRFFFEGRSVRATIDLPGTSDGVDVHADASRAIDFREHGQRLKQYGTAIQAGETATVTLIKVKKDLIEFQLGGGGFGTFLDDTSTSVYIPLVDKSKREKELEKRIHDEDDRDRKRRVEPELDDIRDHRERQNPRINVERERAEG